jgi:hypothetical protein
MQSLQKIACEQLVKLMLARLTSKAEVQDMNAVAMGMTNRPTSEYTSLIVHVTAAKSTAQAKDRGMMKCIPPYIHVIQETPEHKKYYYQQASHGQLAQNCMGTVNDPLRTPPKATSATPRAEDMSRRIRQRASQSSSQADAIASMPKEVGDAAVCQKKWAMQLFARHRSL